MKNSRIIELLKTFSEKEISSLDDFISSKYFNKNEKVTQLFAILKKHYPEFEGSEIEKQNAFVKIFGRKKYEDEKMRTLISVLMKIVKKFLIQVELEKRQHDASLLLLSQLRVRDQQNLLEYEHEKANSHIEKSFHKERDYFYYKYLNDLEFFYGHPTGIKNIQEEDEMVNGIASNLVHSVFFEAMEINYQMLTRKIKMGYEPKYIFLEDIKHKIESNAFADVPLIPMKYYAFMSIKHRENQEYFETCQKLYLENYDKISEFEQASIHLSLINNCMLGISDGEEKFFEKSVELYKFALENNLYFKANKYILPFLFHNIVKNALYIGDVKWVFNFIFEYKNRISPEYRKDIVNLSYSKYYFETKDFDSALKHLNKVSSQHATLKMEYLIHSLKIFYELDYIENVYSAISSIRHFLKTSSHIPSFFRNQMNFLIKYVNKLLKMRHQPDKNELGYLRKEIVSIKNFGLINRKWILEKIDELMK
jgi:hypothetical protein